MFEKQIPEQISIFKCENGFGIEAVSSFGNSNENPEAFAVKRYIAKDINEVIKMVTSYFTDGEI